MLETVSLVCLRFCYLLLIAGLNDVYSPLPYWNRALRRSRVVENFFDGVGNCEDNHSRVSQPLLL